MVNGVPLKSKLDKLEFDGKHVNVVDYKTGDIDKAIPKMKAPHEKDPNGGDYWRQAVFYKILVDNYEQKEWRVISTEFDFIEPDKRRIPERKDRDHAAGHRNGETTDQHGLAKDPGPGFLYRLRKAGLSLVQFHQRQ